MKRICIVVTGLPASGKTTVGWEIAQRLRLPFLDKDDYLEQLFVACGVGDSAWRMQLSLESNRLFQADALKQEKVVVVSHWRPLLGGGQSGTPTEWLLEGFDLVIELYCTCPAELAAERFKSRIRHPGHLDAERTSPETVVWMERFQGWLPLNLGRLITVKTEGEIDFDAVLTQINTAMTAGK